MVRVVQERQEEKGPFYSWKGAVAAACVGVAAVAAAYFTDEGRSARWERQKKKRRNNEEEKQEEGEQHKDGQS